MGKTCFVIMPIGDQSLTTGLVTAAELRKRYDHLIKGALLQARPDLEVLRGDDVAAPGRITTDILVRLMKSDYVLADITYPNPNVFYELGMRHACHPGTILVKDAKAAAPPFDLSDMRYIPYDYTLEGLGGLAESIKRQLDWIDSHPGLPDNQFLDQAKRDEYEFPSYSSKIYPPPIQKAIKDQLYDLNFFKERVVFEVQVTEVQNDEAEFITQLSYLVTNRTKERHDWRMEFLFKYREGGGRVLDVKYKDKPIYMKMLDVQSSRGVSIRRTMEAGETSSVYIKMQERFRIPDYELYTSYHPATDLRVIVRNPFDALEFNFEPFYFTSVSPDRYDDRSEIYFDQGILPHQGLRLSWRGGTDEQHRH
jgi:hypothetical protein